MENHIPVSIPGGNETQFVTYLLTSPYLCDNWRLHVYCNCEIISEKSVRVHKVLQLALRVKSGRGVKKLEKQSFNQRGLPLWIKGGMMMWHVRKGRSEKLVDPNRWMKNRRDGLFDLTSPVEPSKSKIAGTIMVEEVSEELPEERTLINFFPHWAISTRPRPSNKTVGCSQQTG